MRLTSLSLRNAFRQKRRTVFLSASLGFGVFAIVIANSASNGLVENFYDTFSGLFSGHVRIEGREPNGTPVPANIIRKDEALMAAIDARREAVKYVSKKTSFQGTLLYGGKSIRQVITGVDFANEKALPQVLSINGGNLAGLSDPHGIVLSHKAAKALKLAVGETFLVQLTTVNGQLNVGEFTLVATAADMGIVGGYFAFANIGYVNSLVDMAPGEYTSLDVYFKDSKAIASEAKALRERLAGSVNVLPRELSLSRKPDAAYKSLQGPAYSFVTLEDNMQDVKEVAHGFDASAYMLSVLVFIVVFVGVNNSFKIILRDRVKEIGTLRALGMRKRDVVYLFVAEGEFLALFGAAGGTLAALLVMGAIHLLVDFGSESPLAILLSNGRIHFAPTPLILLKGFLVSGALVFFAVYFTARAAARKRPAETLAAIT
jgi:putative ABC transport system permease protein